MDFIACSLFCRQSMCAWGEEEDMLMSITSPLLSLLSTPTKIIPPSRQKAKRHAYPGSLPDVCWYGVTASQAAFAFGGRQDHGFSLSYDLMYLKLLY